MNNKLTAYRIFHASLALIILVTEVLIALYVRDTIIRPYGGDVLVVVFIGCVIRAVLPFKIKYLSVYLFLFSFSVEIGQYFNYAKLLGLDKYEFFRILLGTSFSYIDIVCYAVGCAIFALLDAVLMKKILQREID